MHFCVVNPFPDNLTLAANFSVQLTFRTSSRDGIIFLIMGQAVDDSGESFERKQQSNVILTLH